MPFDTGNRRPVKPRALTIDASSICQLKCGGCPTGRRELNASDIGSGFLKFSDFRTLLDGNPWLSEANLTSWGETFLNPELADMFAYARSKKVGILVGSNMNMTEDDALEAMVKFKVRSINCSIDGASQETYSVYRAGGSFKKVIENIEKLNRFKDKYRSHYPVVKWQFLVFGHNEHEISTAKRMAHELGMEFVLALPHEIDFPMGLPMECEFSRVKDEETVRSELGYSTREEYKSKFGRDPLFGACLALWAQPAINWDGTLLGCCATRFGFGANVFTEGLVKAVNSERISYARRMVEGLEPPREDIPCSRCTLYKEMGDSGIWIKRSLTYRAMRFTYSYLRLPYAVTRKAYRFLGLARFWE